MTDLRTAAQQALESLKGYRRELGDQQPCDAEQALDTALAEPVQESVKLPTTPAEAELMVKLGLTWLEQNAPDRLLKTVQKPVYWEVRCNANPKWMRVDEQQFDEYVSHGWEGQKLYTAPSQLEKGVK